MEWNANGDRTPASPLFAFGSGLSFTTFGLSNATIGRSVARPAAAATAAAAQRAALGMLAPPPVASLRVTATASNTGGVAGAVVVFVTYTKKPHGVVRWARMMCGFTKTHLEPGESREVSVDVKVSDLARWDTRQRSTDLDGKVVTGVFGRRRSLVTFCQRPLAFLSR